MFLNLQNGKDDAISQVAVILKWENYEWKHLWAIEENYTFHFSDYWWNEHNAFLYDNTKDQMR